VKDIRELEARMESAEFWDTPKQAQKIVADLKGLKAQIDPLKGVIADFEDAKLAYEMAKESDDKALLAEADEKLYSIYGKPREDVSGRMDKIELQSLLSGKHDHRNAFLTIQAGAGGKEANDWADMILRMYIFYCEKMGFGMEEIAKTYGTEVGVDQVTLHIKGPFAFGYLNCERGTHRLARVSPFNAEGKRQTSFATVDVIPEFEETNLEIPEKDLEVTPFVRASGPGGQNVNKVASAIRIVHKPTGIMVVASTFRDQPQNKKQAMNVLMAKLEQIEEERKEKELNAATGGAVERGWGTQIRSYVFYDNRVKDHRTNHESTDYERVLRGELQPFIDAELQRRRKERTGQ
jgi:peptide chain release factor 2